MNVDQIGTCLVKSPGQLRPVQIVYGILLKDHMLSSEVQQSYIQRPIPNVHIRDNLQGRYQTSQTPIVNLFGSRRLATINICSALATIGCCSSPLKLSARGEIEVDARGQTSVPGVFAAGDCTIVPYKQIVIAMGEGAKASLGAFDHLIRSPLSVAA